MEPYVTQKSLKDCTRRWLDEIAPFNQHRMALNRDRSALLVIDMQNFFLDPDSETFIDGGHAVLPNIKELVEAFRKAGRPVIYTRHVHNPDGSDVGIMGWWWKGMCREGHPESEVVADIIPEKGEKVILKHRYSAFYNTDLETVLRCMKIEDLVITGLMTNLCCESTTRDAYFRDFRIFFLADGTGTVTDDMHLATLLNVAYGFAYVTTAEDIARQLR